MIGGGSLNKDSLSKIQIPIPSLEIQQQIISQYEEKMKSIDEIKNKILNVENIILECNAQQKLLFYI
jgi:restriction endonuclease S subunit